PPSSRSRRSPRVRRVTFAPSTRRIYELSDPGDVGLRVRRLPCPRASGPASSSALPTLASYALRVPRAGAPPTTSSARAPRGPALAARPAPTAPESVRCLGDPVTWAPRGLAPPGHFPLGFHLPV